MIKKIVQIWNNLKHRYYRWKEWCRYSKWNKVSKVLVLLGLKKSTWFDTFMVDPFTTREYDSNE